MLRVLTNGVSIKKKKQKEKGIKCCPKKGDKSNSVNKQKVSFEPEDAFYERLQINVTDSDCT
jgi:hypothetical protein